jgi:hypothetical protein
MGEETAQFISGFKKSDLITHSPEIIGSDQSGWTSTNNGYLLILLLGGVKLKIRFLNMIDKESFQMANGDGLILLDSLTLLLAGVRTGIGENSWKRKFLPHQCKGLFKLPLRDERHITLSVTMERAGGRARRDSSPVDGIFERDGLWERDVDGLFFPQSHIKFIGECDRTLRHTVCAGCAFRTIHITGFLPEDHLEMSSFPFDMDHL